jgi:hypothetical protein
MELDQSKRRQRRRRIVALILGVGATAVILALCANLAYSVGFVGFIAATSYNNTSPPFITTQAGVTVELAHSILWHGQI